MKLSRERTDTLFRIHVSEGGLKDISNLVKLDKFTYQLVRDGVTHRALVLSRSWDYWEYRLSRSAPAVSMVICSKHDTCLPVAVLEVGSSGYTYGPRELPLDHHKDAPRTPKTALVFLGALLCGDQQAFDKLHQMHPSSQKRCRRRLSRLLTENRLGNQLIISKALQSLEDAQAVSS
jgi:hypothetical protein